MPCEADMCIRAFHGSSMSSPSRQIKCVVVGDGTVGTKLDLRDEANPRSTGTEDRPPITKSQGQKCAQKIKAVKYLECSALTQQGLKQVFEDAVRAVINPKPLKQKKSCTLL
ncbi:Ras family protein [Ancylostoma ceylanicum]|uniref:Ras family protein n=1 Tax=Ancylostoma ceylanicum TaxID=53326 RepID=A0A0D6MBN3_9BILA|nr:Ras family protein [Ancylostoma ceylanicum]